MFALKINSTNQIQYDSFGRTYLSDSEVECTGAKWWSQSMQKHVDGVIEWRSDNLELLEEEVLVDSDGHMTTFQDQLAFPDHCTVEKSSCKADEGTWGWNDLSEREQCRLFLTRTVVGTEMSVLDQGKVVTAFVDDKIMVRLVLRGNMVLCNRQACFRSQFFLYRSIVQFIFFQSFNRSSFKLFSVQSFSSAFSSPRLPISKDEH